MRSRPSESPPEPAVRRRPVVSVCIVNWNCRALLKACLRSLKSKLQRLRLEVIVVDNASTDGAAEMVRRRFPRVVLVQNADNVGFARANNQAARLVRGRWLFFLNNDTVVPPGALRQLVEYARRTRKSACSAHGCATAADGRRRRTAAGRPSPPCCTPPVCCAGRGCSAPPTAATAAAAASRTPFGRSRC